MTSSRFCFHCGHENTMIETGKFDPDSGIKKTAWSECPDARKHGDHDFQPNSRFFLPAMRCSRCRELFSSTWD